MAKFSDRYHRQVPNVGKGFSRLSEIVITLEPNYCTKICCVEWGDRILESRKCVTARTARCFANRDYGWSSSGSIVEIAIELLENVSYTSRKLRLWRASSRLPKKIPTPTKSFRLSILKLPTLSCMNRVGPNILVDKGLAAMQVPSIAYRMKTGNSTLTFRAESSSFQISDCISPLRRLMSRTNYLEFVTLTTTFADFSLTHIAVDIGCGERVIILYLSMSSFETHWPNISLDFVSFTK